MESQNFFAYKRADANIAQIQKEDKTSNSSLEFQILHGEWFAYTRGLVERYLIYFSPKMLFIDGDYSPRHRVPDLGILYYFSVVLIPLGFLFLLRNKNRYSWIIFYWLLIAPIPAVLSRDLINMVRALNLVIPFSILEGAGLVFLVSSVIKIKKIFFIPAIFMVVFLMVTNFAIFLDRYFVHAPVEYSEGWLYGYKQAVNFLNSENPKPTGDYNKIVISDTYGQPYIYYLFYSKYDPLKYQKQAHLEQNGPDVGTVRKIDNLEFRHIFWPGDRGTRNSLFIGPIEELPTQDIEPFKEFKILKQIDYLDNLPAFRIVESK